LGECVVDLVADFWMDGLESDVVRMCLLPTAGVVLVLVGGGWLITIDVVVNLQTVMY
jgi:hypothetical protein